MVEPSGSELDRPKSDQPDLHKRIGQSFPSLGFYPVVDPAGDIQQSVGLADAIDDLADIARDLMEVVARAERGEMRDAIWQFRFGYELHWGATSTA